MNQTIAVVHNAVKDSSLPDEQDVLIQVEAVFEALKLLGYKPEPLPCDLDLENLKSRILEIENSSSKTSKRSNIKDSSI